MKPAQVRECIASLPADRFPNLIAAAPRVFTGSPDERFTFGLDLLLDGLERRRPPAQG